MIIKKDIYLFNFKRDCKTISFLYLTKQGFYKAVLNAKTGDCLEDEYLNNSIKNTIIEDKKVYTIFKQDNRIIGIAEANRNASYGFFNRVLN